MLILLRCSAVQRWRYRVDGCYLWSTGSWDVLAVYPESTSTEGSYFDPVVADIIAKHNKKVCSCSSRKCATPPQRDQL